ncbi:MAG: hypothetical protein NW220_02780 [Leptolyngbyaceae cyanobacterium bins.349]|nr:hypothetical protein [Leptolyngbyaceae cyanobacterium bins.349]
MTAIASFAHAPDVSADDYIVLGYATCFLKQDGEVQEVKVAEPIPSATLEALMTGIPTSYEWAIATTVGAILVDGTPQLPEPFPAGTQICDEFGDRAIAATRTYKARPVAQAHIPAGTTKTDFNYSTERKRVLNSKRTVRKEDNVKQHEYTHKVL